MNEIKRRYKNKCKKRQIVFYKKDNEIYEKSKLINFQRFVKLCLKYMNDCDTAIMYAQCEERQTRKVKENGKTNL